MTKKHIQVEYATHKQAKEQARKRGMLLRTYIQMLLDKDEKSLRKV